MRETAGSHFFKSEKREFTRVKIDLSVRYQFLSQKPDDNRTGLGKTEEGRTRDISAGGFLLLGKVPKVSWISDLLMQKLIVYASIDLPDGKPPIEALTRVAWLETIDEENLTCAMGLSFREVAREDQDRIFRFVIRSKAPDSL